MFPDSQIAKGYKLDETKMKYTIQSGIARYFRDLIRNNLKNVPYSFKFGQKINVLRYQTMAL